MDKSKVIIPRDSLLILNDQETRTNSVELSLFTYCREKLDDIFNAFFEAQEKRFNRFTELLLKVWKVSDDNGPFCYLYPYRAIKTNHCIFCLKSNIPKGDYIQYSGIEEFTLHTDDWCLYPDIEFTESTMDEMIEHAKRADDIIVHNRIVKLKERGIITDDLKPTGNVESEGDVPAKTD